MYVCIPVCLVFREGCMYRHHVCRMYVYIYACMHVRAVYGLGWIVLDCVGWVDGWDGWIDGWDGMGWVGGIDLVDGKDGKDGNRWDG